MEYGVLDKAANFLVHSSHVSAVGHIERPVFSKVTLKEIPHLMKLLWDSFIDAWRRACVGELKSRDLLFPSLNLTWVYGELNHRWKSSIWLLKASLKPPKINPLEFLSLEVIKQLFSTSKIILNCSHQMFISTVQNTRSRDNTRTANKNYNHTDWNAAALKGITVPLPQRLSVSIRWCWPQSHARTALKINPDYG